MKAFTSLVVIVLLVAAAPQQDAAQELAKFEGTWQPTYVEIDGKPFKGDYSQDRLVITGKAFRLMGPKVEQEGTMSVDPSKKPRAIDEEITSGAGKGTKTVGIYEIDAKQLMVCYRKVPADRPKEFTTKGGSETVLVVYKRVKS